MLAATVMCILHSFIQTYLSSRYSTFPIDSESKFVKHLRFGRLSFLTVRVLKLFARTVNLFILLYRSKAMEMLNFFPLQAIAVSVSSL